MKLSNWCQCFPNNKTDLLTAYPLHYPHVFFNFAKAVSDMFGCCLLQISGMCMFYMFFYADKTNKQTKTQPTLVIKMHSFLSKLKCSLRLHEIKLMLYFILNSSYIPNILPSFFSPGNYCFLIVISTALCS